MSDNNFFDRTITFSCGDSVLHGVLSVPEQSFDSAVIIVVGGPQFRVGSHRQFVLLARFLARQGILALRFDYTGMGYSEGLPKQFYQVDEDIKSAIDYVATNFSYVKNINLWGLCDAASAIAFTAYTDARINRLILLNPWVRSDASHSEAILKDYYKGRFLSVEFWKDVLAAPHKKIGAVFSFFTVFIRVLMNKLLTFVVGKSATHKIEEISQQDRIDEIALAVLTGLTRFNGKICLLLCGNDLVADEFKREFENRQWMNNAENAQKITIHHVPEADHTFSTAAWRAKAEQLTLSFLYDE